MDIIDLPLPSHILETLSRVESFTTLNPPQTEVVEAGLFDRKNFLIAIPTASGKTFIAELCALQHILVFHKKVIYLTPLKALAFEKFQDFKRFRPLGVKVGIALGDYDSNDSHLLANYDIIISTNEKIDSLLRHNRTFMQDTISLLVIDECHLIDDASRGPTLETLIVKIKKINQSIQLLALSATVQNSEEVAEWLGATLIKSSWRSVPIKEFFCNQEGTIFNRETQIIRKVSSTAILENLVRETIADKAQVLVFANSRRTAQSIATSLKDTVKNYLSGSDYQKILVSLKTLKKKNQTEDKTSSSLVSVLRNGVGFHHAGLSNEQRVIVETLFKQHILKVIVATPTLAAGINLPARRVIISSIWRFSTTSSNMSPIKVMEYEQMRGRSGRPKYDSFGESFVLASSERDEEIVWEKYFSSDGSENIESKLSPRPTLRIHLLGVLATGIVKTYNNLSDFLQQTFYGHQFNDIQLLERNLHQVTDDLEKFGYLKIKNENLIVTRLGRRVSQLYIDPVTADIIIKSIIKSLAFPDYNPLMFLHIFCLVPDIRRIRIKGKEWKAITTLYENLGQLRLSGPDIIRNFNIENDTEALKNALIIQDWIEETPLQKILEYYDLTLGDFQRLQETVSWVSYSAKELVKELVKILNEQDLTDFIYVEKLSNYSLEELKYLQKYLTGLEMRISDGIKEDLLKIIELKGLGRVKARTLVDNGITSIEKLKTISPEQLLTFPGFGPKLVQSISEQLGIQTELSDLQLKSQNQNNFNNKSRPIKTTKKTGSLIDYIKEK